MSISKMSISKKLCTPAFVAVFALTVAGCAGTPPTNPRLVEIEGELHSAYNDKYVAEYGQADLVKAEASLALARVAIQKGHDAEMEHDFVMADGYVSLASIHGRQEQTKAETVALKDRQDRIRLAARDRDVNRANAATQDANDRADISNANAAAAQSATQSAQDKMTAMRTQLSVYDMRMNELGATLVLRDVMFDVNSSTLHAGAVNRLDPLIAYLHANPATTVRIEGHTDNSGSVERNNVLSLGRADSVKRSLQANGTVSNAITTIGYGQEKPIASNATVSGREQNRRVEITLQ